MKSLKDEMRQIEQPAELHKHVVIGIERAAKEKQRKKWLPTFLTIPLTAAVAYFIWLVSTAPNLEHNTQAAGLVQPLTNTYWLASICTVLLVTIVWNLGKSHKKWRKQWALTLLVALSWVWNSAYYEAQQLPRPYVYPVSVNLEERSGYQSIYIHAIINKSEFENTIRAVVINDTTFAVNGDYSLSLGSTAHHMTTNAALNFQVEDLNRLMMQRSPIEAYALFLDGEKIPFDIQFTQFVQGDDSEGFGFEVDSNGNHKELFKTDMTTITAITPPPVIQHYKLESRGKVIKRVNMAGEEDIDLLPYAIDDTLLELSYQLSDERELRSYQSLYFIIETTDGTINKRANILFPPFSHKIVKEIRQEMIAND
ncbi:hypothetical protein [Metasolibacillus sp.]|uniref:hypothetical protein n=1 Tax=Metasolibacillus sp. TaxID=2703680 RepID=UPI0025EDC61B|nr:hypothetical protein [Metasolibacillus sp.]MCT6923221.1 hypothetical protein [Metasolibacillus sp.]MCT6939474.1 hypothetical protein [Metasolibacillus sp.]